MKSGDLIYVPEVGFCGQVSRVQGETLTWHFLQENRSRVLIRIHCGTVRRDECQLVRSDSLGDR